MVKDKSVYFNGTIMIDLDQVAGARLTGENQDTITVFFKHRDSVYFYVGSDARKVFAEMVEQYKIATTKGWD